MVRDTVLIGSEDFDATTDLVLQWLDYNKVQFRRINDEDDIVVRQVEITAQGVYFELLVNGKDLISSNKIKSFWFRRGGTSLTIPDIAYNSSVVISGADKRRLSRSIRREIIRLEEFLGEILEKDPNFLSLGNPNNSINNKLLHLNAAKASGLRVPATYILTDLETLIGKMALHNNGLITKSISDTSAIFFTDDDNEFRYILYTNRIEEEDLERLPKKFPPSLFQERIQKKLELRVFYIKNECYTTAIFSQDDKKTAEDFRRYNWAKLNRYIPFKLPYIIEANIHKFMQIANLNSGSLDLIYGEDKEYYFLEVNPVGQFGMISYPCNYYLEKKVADLLK